MTGESHDDASAPPPTAVVQAIQRRNWTRSIVAVVAAIVLLVGAGWVTGAIANQFADSPAERALAEIEAAPDGVVAASADEGEGVPVVTVYGSSTLARAVLVAESLPAPADDRELIVWYRTPDTVTNVGSFVPIDGAAIIELRGIWDLNTEILVTDEPLGGSSSGEPTTDPIVTITP